MKTVQSQVLSSEPIPLSDTTSFLSNFNKSVCGASAGVSHETCWFLRRALASFEELEQLHQKLNEPRSDRKRRRHGSETRNDDAETTVGDNPAQSFVASRDVSSKPKCHRQQESDDNRKVVVVEQSRGKGGIRNLGEDGGEIAERVGVSVEKREAGDSVEIGGDKMKKKKKKKKKKKRDAIGKIDENGGRIEEGDGESEMGNEEVKKEGDFRNSEEDDSQDMKKKKKKKKKKKRGNVDENGGENKMENEELRRQEKKKRKSGVLENGDTDALEEQQEKEKRKKRRKS